VARDACDGGIEGFVRAGLRKTSLARIVSRIREMDVTVCERGEQRRTVEVDSLASKTRRIFVESDDAGSINEHGRVAHEAS
jgi:hypothetical protein